MKFFLSAHITPFTLYKYKKLQLLTTIVYTCKRMYLCKRRDFYVGRPVQLLMLNKVFSIQLRKQP